jgi:hypothetical protein
MMAHTDAFTTPFCLSVLTATRGNASKRLIADAHGKPIKDPSHSLAISTGTLEHAELAGLIGFGELLQRVTPKQALVHGIAKGTTPGTSLALVRADKYTGAPGTVARTLDCIAYPSGIHLLMFDVDPSQEAPVTVASAHELMTHLSAIWPTVAEVGWLATTSTSSAIRCKVSGTWLRPPEGMHVYVLTTGDVARWRDLAQVRLWLAGTGYCKLATPNSHTGVASILERCLIDLTVFSPERLDYVAGALIDKSAPFVQDRPAPELHAGGVLDLDALPDVTADERTEYARLVAEARACIAPAQRATVRAHITTATPTMPDAKVEDEVTARIDQAERGELAPDHPLYFDTSACTASILTKALDGKRLRDPLKPDYGPSQAVFHWRGGDWRIVSWAHGIKKIYRLAPLALDASQPQTAPTAAAPSSTGSSIGKPTIQLDTELSRWTDEGQTALLSLTKANGAPIIYQRARRIVLIATSVKPPRWLHRPPDAPVIIEASDAALYELAGMAATWQKWEKRAKAWVNILPSKLFVSTLLGRPFWPFPPLEGIIHSPTLRPDGSLLATPGYDTDTWLYFDSNGTSYPPIPDDPDIFEAQHALNTLKDVLCDFLWAHDYDRSAALAAILSVVCRYTVIGNVPLFGISATTRGSGKGLLADVIALIGTGRRAPLWSQAEDDAEERKRLLTLGMDGDPLVCIDNVTRPLGSGPLDLALTSSTFKDRILGTQTSKEVPMHVVFLATGNNLQYVGDLARRVVSITLDPKMEKPEERTGFRYPDLLAHVAQERPRLVIAALTILKAYFADGCPSQGLSAYGSFQPWSDLIRSALVWAGEEDPCEGRKTIEAHDPGYEALAGLLEAWHTCYPAGAKITLKRLKQDVTVYKDSSTPPAPNEWDDLEHAVFEFDQRSARTKAIDTLTLGNALKRVQGRVIGGKRLVEDGKYNRAAQWVIETI